MTDYIQCKDTRSTVNKNTCYTFFPANWNAERDVYINRMMTMMQEGCAALGIQLKTYFYDER